MSTAEEQAIERIAMRLRNQAEAAVSRANLEAGDHAKVTPVDVDYNAKAAELLETCAIQLARDEALRRIDQAQASHEKWNDDFRPSVTTPSPPSPPTIGR